MTTILKKSGSSFRPAFSSYSLVPHFGDAPHRLFDIRKRCDPFDPQLRHLFGLAIYTDY